LLITLHENKRLKVIDKVRNYSCYILTSHVTCVRRSIVITNGWSEEIVYREEKFAKA
jgi:hypothetical protein